MKIAYFLDFPGCIGGASKVLMTQAYIMGKKEHEVVVVIPEDENGQHTYEFDEISKNFNLNVITAKYSVATSLEGIDIVAALQDCKGIIQVLSEKNVDLIHSTQINVAVELAARELGIPHLMNIYPTEVEAFDIKWLDVYPHYHSADSDFFCKRWSEGLHIPSRCIRVAYKNQCSKADGKMRGLCLPIQIISIGVLAEHKNQIEVLKFVLSCKRMGLPVILTILGKNDTLYGQKCKEFVKQNDLEGEVIFQGVVLNIEDYLAQSDLMILSSVTESYPGVIVESMANRVPVIATPIAGIPELMKDGYNGFLTKGCKSEDINEAFDIFLHYKRDGRIQKIIDHGYETYEQHHSYEAVGKRLESYYNWILRKYDRRSFDIKSSNVKKILEKFVTEKNMKQADKYTQKSIWFLYHLHKKLKENKPQKIAIWGAGHWGKIALEWLDLLECKDYFVGFIDTYKTGKYLSYPILENMEQSVEECDVIFLAIGNVDNCLKVMKYLEKYGKKKNTSYFTLLHELIRI